MSRNCAPISWLLASLVWSSALGPGQAVVSLRKLSSVYLPYNYREDSVLGVTAEYSLTTNAAVQSAYDRSHATVYTVGGMFMHVLDFTEPGKPRVLHHQNMSMAVIDVEVCGDVVALAVLNSMVGQVQLYRLYNRQTRELLLLDSVMIGSRLSMVKFTSDCRTIVVVNEGMPKWPGSEGSITILGLNGQGSVLETVELNFTSFNERADEYVRRGVRWPTRGDTELSRNTLSRSLEPEQVALNEQGTKAYISLQENNAIAVVDLRAKVIEDIYPLGYKSWKGLKLDASDMDSGINFGTYDIYSLYQPDAIRYMEVDGTGYLVTANEGDDEGFDAKRGKYFVEDDQLSDSVSQELRTALVNDSQLGRLEFSTVDGQSTQDPDKFDRLVFFGGRSVSVFRADDMALVYDTGDEFELRHADLQPEVFNTHFSHQSQHLKTPGDVSDESSDNKGIEPEILEFGEVNGKRLLFVTSERVSSLMVYSFHGDSFTPTFESIYRAGGTNDTYTDLYEDRNAGDLDPEDLRFIAASDTPVGRPLLLVTGKVSGTVSMYEVVDSEETADSEPDTTVVLKPVSTVYIPIGYETSGEGQYGINEGAVEQSAYDPANAIMYCVGDMFMHVIDISDVTRPAIVHYQELPSAGNDVELCGSVVAVALDGNPGTIQLFSLYDATVKQVAPISSVQVATRPDMLKFTKDCRTLVVANEGEDMEEDDVIVVNEGYISVIQLNADGTVFKSTFVDFKSFNERAAEYVDRGVRWPYRGELSRQPTNLSQSLEPEYIAFNKDETKAYVCLQENNAIAVVDLSTKVAEEIFPLGLKPWRNLQLDASDKDGGINFASYDIYSVYQPDAMKFMEVDGIGYLLTANEGDALSYEAGDQTWEEDQRGEKFVENDQLSSSVSEELRSALGDDAKLGRLQFSTVDGQSTQDPDKFDRLVFFGGRGFSVFRADDMALVYDSGDEVELRHAAQYPRVFNAKGDSDKPDEETPADKMDGRSDNKGPECEAVETGMLNGKRLLFVGQESVSSILVYSFAEHSALPTYESLYRAGGTERTFSQLLDDRDLGDLDPEDLRFIPAEDSPSGQPLLLVTGARSGTLAIYEVTEDSGSGDDNTGAASRAHSQWVTVAFAVGAFVVNMMRSSL